MSDSALGGLTDWSVTAVNLPEHADNPIHTDAGAQAAGFPGALVAGVSSYALMTHVPVSAWGDAWIAGGGAHVRFGAPVFDGDSVDCVVVADDGEAGEPERAVVELRVEGQRRASCVLFEQGPTMPIRAGERMEPIVVTPGAEWSDYGTRLGDPDRRYVARSLIHPAAWLAWANRVFHTQLVSGSWIHTRSLIAHHRLVELGETITIETIVVDRFDSRAGKRAVADVRISCGDEPVASIEHEAVIEVAPA